MANQVWYLDGDEVKSGRPDASNERYMVFVPCGAEYPKIINKDDCFDSYPKAVNALVKKLSVQSEILSRKLGNAFVELSKYADPQPAK